MRGFATAYEYVYRYMHMSQLGQNSLPQYRRASPLYDIRCNNVNIITCVKKLTCMHLILPHQKLNTVKRRN